MVPDYAEAHIAASIEDIGEQFKTFLNVHDVTGDIQEDDGKTIINFNGKSAHAMEPDHGVNAAVLLATFLNRFLQKVHLKTLHNSWQMHLAMKHVDVF